MSGSRNRDDVNMLSVKEENVCDMGEYQSIFEKLKKLHEIARTNDEPSTSSTNNNENKLAPKRKTDLDLDVLSDDSALNATNKTKRRRFSDSQDYSESGEFDVRDYCPQNNNKMYVISISNLPGEWTYDKIKQYVTDECGVNVVKMTDSRSDRSDYQLRLRFSNEEQYKNVLGKLKCKEVEGKLKVVVIDEDDSDSDTSDTTFIIGKSDIKSEEKSWKQDDTEWEPEGLYGLKPEFLQSLNIKPPLTKWIHVTNFRCDKSELRDVFEMAGRVISCIVVNTINKYAKVMYSHPLEAVQAISMLNGQFFYGQRLNVSLDPYAETALPLPKGLLSYGIGFGESGKPLRDVVSEFERFVMGQHSNINSSLFCPAQKTPMEPYVPVKRSHSSENLGQFGPIGQKKTTLSTDDNRGTNLKHVNYPFANSPRPGPSSIPYGPRPQNGPMLSNRMTPPGTGPMPGPNMRPVLPSHNIPIRLPGPNMPAPPGCNPGPNLQPPQFHGPNYPGPLGPNQGLLLQGQKRPMYPGSGPNFVGPGPNFQCPPSNQGPMGPNFPQNLPPGGPNFQSPAQFPNRFPLDKNQFNQRPITNMNVPRMFEPGQNPSMVPRPVASNVPGPKDPRTPEKGILVLRSNDPVTLQITNLPPTVTFASLCGKLSKVGQVVSLEFTTPGCAVVKFGNPSEAERCFHYYSPARFGNDLGR
ncbi:uncharacterized protein LOC119839719 [Zerene cesonia]|uniref:uncharacterized protein LOC119839719 n=1 Tax=Zerene cesonia TaxID=33412 RepID=UPI0018E54DFA|nr:uncharacterized protein LOC119839719 [Zerene cesonia]